VAQRKSFPPLLLIRLLETVQSFNVAVPSHGVQSFRNRLLQCGSLRGSQVLPANLLQLGLLSPQAYRSSQKPAPLTALHGVTTSFGHPPALVWGPPWLQLQICSTVDLHGLRWDSLPHHGLLQKLQGNFCSSGWSTFFPSSFTDLVQSRLSHVFLVLSPRYYVQRFSP